MKNIREYELIVWDLDGTLYYQSPFRKKMVLVLLKGLLLKPWKWQELYIIWQFRKVREQWDPQDTDLNLTERQYETTASKCYCSPQKVLRVIEYWMMQMPNQYLKAYQDKNAASWIEELMQRGKKVVVWSDYPVEEKLKALDIQVTDFVCSTDNCVGAMKPNSKGLQVIMEKHLISKDKVLMVGDREEKDGMAAQSAGVDWVILSKNKKKRETQYQSWVDSE